MKILIADDSRAMRQVVAFMLREAGYRGHTARKHSSWRGASCQT